MTRGPLASSHLHKELAAAVAQQLVQSHLHIKGGPLPADVQVLPRQRATLSTVPAQHAACQLPLCQAVMMHIR